VKRSSSEADASSSTRIRRKTSHDSERVHRKECTETEDISSTAKQAVTNAGKYASLIENHVMSKHDKRRIINEKATSQKEQRLREKSSSLRKKREVMIKIADREEIKKMQKKIVEQILQRIADMSMSQQNLIMSLCKLSSKDIFLHAVSSDT